MDMRMVTAPDADAQALKQMGYEQSMKREFTFFSAFSIAFAFISPIIAIYSIFAFSLLSGGPAMWWGFLVVLAGQLLVAFVFAECASIFPLAGGVYQWARQLLGRAFGWAAAWAYGWTLIFTIAAIAYSAAGFLAAALGIDAPGIWTLIGLGLALIVFATAINTAGRRFLKIVVALSIGCEFVASIVIGTILLIAYRENSLSVIFDSFGVSGNASYFGFAPVGFFAALAFIGWASVGFESAGAVGEEVRNPRRDVPKAIVLSLAIVGAVVIYAALALILAIPNLDAVLAGEVGDPITDTLAAQLGIGIATPLFAVVTLGMTAGMIAIQTACSRTIFSLARDRGLPWSRFLARLSVQDRLPINAIVICALLTSIALLLAKTNIFVTLITFATGGFYIAFAFPVVAALVNRLRGTWQPGEFSLGRIGLGVTVVALAWQVFETVNIAWPRLPGSPWYQNYAVAVGIGVLTLVGVAIYAQRREQFAGEPLSAEVLAGPMVAPGSVASAPSGVTVDER